MTASVASEYLAISLNFDFYVTPWLSETVSPNFTKFDRIDLLTLGHVPAKHDVINYFLSAADAILKKNILVKLNYWP